MKTIIPAKVNDDDVVDGIVITPLRPETLHMIFSCLDTALFLFFLWVMYLLIGNGIFPLFGLPVLLLRLTWYFRAQKVWKELGIGEDGKPVRGRKRNHRQ